MGINLQDLGMSPMEFSLLRKINAYRAANGKPEVAYSRGLNSVSAWMSHDMAELRNKYGSDPTNGYPTAAHPLSHTDSLGRDTWAREHAMGWDTENAQWGGECIAFGPNDAEVIFQAWRNSPGHNAIMLGDHYLYAAVNAYKSLDGMWFWTLDMSSLDDPTYDVDWISGAIYHMNGTAIVSVTLAPPVTIP